MSGVVVDPFQDALNLVAEPVKELLAVPNPDTAGDPLRSHSDTAGIMLAPVAVCSHNSVGVMHGTLASDGSWIPNELPWKVGGRARAYNSVRVLLTRIGNGAACGGLNNSQSQLSYPSLVAHAVPPRAHRHSAGAVQHLDLPTHAVFH